MKYFFIGLCVFFLFLCPVAYGDISEIEVDWILEDQYDNESIISEKNSVNEIIEFYDEHEIFSEFITNNQYTIGGEKIDVHSKEGQLLNKILIEQKKINKENFLHMIHYLDRYSDGYIELAEALLDPVNQQKYQINGRVYDGDINSNLEYFLFERGYAADNFESIPNSIFSPIKYDDARAQMSKELSSGNGDHDLRNYIPQYVDTSDPKIINQKMTLDLFDQISSTHDSIFNPEINNIFSKSSVSENLFDKSFENTLIPGTTFENTQHVIDDVDSSSEFSLNNSDPLTIILVLILLSTISGLILLGYVLLQKTKISKPQLLVESNLPSVSIEQKTKDMLNLSINLFKNNSHKDAFEKLGQTIRFYYCNKLNLNVEMTSFEIISELKQSKINDFENIIKWLLLCGSVEFTKHQSHKTEFDNIVSSFLKQIS